MLLGLTLQEDQDCQHFLMALHVKIIPASEVETEIQHFTSVVSKKV